MTLENILKSAKQSLLGKTAPYLLSLGLALTPTFACEKPDDDDVADDDTISTDYDVTIHEATTDSEGKAYFEDAQSGEEVIVHDRDEISGSPIEGAKITFIDANGFEVFVGEKAGYRNSFDIFPHNSPQEIYQGNVDDADFTLWDRLHNENPEQQDAWESWQDWIQNCEGTDCYVYDGCFTREELIQGREDTMQLITWVATLGGGDNETFWKFISAAYDGLVQMAEWGVIEDLPYDYYDVWSTPVNFTAPPLFVGREEPCPAEDICTGGELFCDDFNSLDESVWNTIGDVYVESGRLFLGEPGLASTNGIALPSTNYDVTFQTLVTLGDEGLYDITFKTAAEVDSALLLSFGIDENRGYCSGIYNGVTNFYDIGDLEEGVIEIIMEKRGDSINLIIDGEEKFSDNECLEGVDFNYFTLGYGGDNPSLYIDYSIVE